MADIFDKINPSPQTKQGGDIFDKINPPATGTFDQLQTQRFQKQFGLDPAEAQRVAFDVKTKGYDRAVKDLGQRQTAQRGTAVVTEMNKNPIKAIPSVLSGEIGQLVDAPITRLTGQEPNEVPGASNMEKFVPGFSGALNNATGAKKVALSLVAGASAPSNALLIGAQPVSEALGVTKAAAAADAANVALQGVNLAGASEHIKEDPLNFAIQLGLSGVMAAGPAVRGLKMKEEANVRTQAHVDAQAGATRQMADLEAQARERSQSQAETSAQAQVQAQARIEPSLVNPSEHLAEPTAFASDHVAPPVEVPKAKSGVDTFVSDLKDPELQQLKDGLGTRMAVAETKAEMTRIKRLNSAVDAEFARREALKSEEFNGHTTEPLAEGVERPAASVDTGVEPVGTVGVEPHSGEGELGGSAGEGVSVPGHNADTTGSIVPMREKLLPREHLPEGTVQGIKEGARDISDPFATHERAIDASLRGTPEYGTVKSYLVDSRKQAVTNLHDEAVDWNQKLRNELPINVKDKEASALTMQYGEGKIDLAQLQAARPKDWQNIVAANDWFRKSYDFLLDRVNASREAVGVQPIPKRADYYTHFQEERSIWDRLMKRDPYEGMSGNPFDYSYRSRTYNPFAKERTGTEPQKYDAVKAFEAYLGPSLNEIHMTEIAKRNRDLSFALDKAGGAPKGLLHHLDMQADSLIYKEHPLNQALIDSTIGHKLGDKLMYVMDWFRQRSAANTILGNLSTAFVHSGQLAIAVPKVGVEYMLRGLGDEVGALLTGQRTARDVSPFIRRRYEAIKGVREGWFQKAERAGMTPLLFVEETTTSAIWRGLMKKARAEGLSFKDAVQASDDMTEKLVAGRALGEVPPVFKTDVGRIFGQFQLQATNMLEYLGRDLKWDGATRMGKTDASVQVVKAMIGLHLMSMLYQSVIGRKHMIDPVGAAVDVAKNSTDKRKPTGQKVAEGFERVTGEALAGMPWGQMVAQLVPEDQRKKWFGQSEVGTMAGGAPIFTTAAQAIKDPARAAASLVPPIGGNQALKTYRGVQAVRQGGVPGKFRIETPVDKTKAVLFGPNATGAAQESFRRRQLR